MQLPLRGFGFAAYKLTGGRLSRSGYRRLRRQSKQIVGELSPAQVRALARRSARR